jgi:hypothetical protein
LKKTQKTKKGSNLIKDNLQPLSFQIFAKKNSQSPKNLYQTNATKLGKIKCNKKKS